MATIEWFGGHFLGQELNTVPETFDSYVSNDTTIESDEGISWPAKAIHSEHELLLILEAGWSDESKIQVINIISPRIVSVNGIAIGSHFGKIRQYLSHDIPSEPDGYFAIRDSSEKSILYYFDVSAEDNLYLGNKEFDSIPDDLTIEAIQIQLLRGEL